MSGPRPGIPWYVHPAEDPVAWRRLGALLADADGLGDGFVVVNVHNGPGAADDPYYGPALQELRSAAPGLVVLGYVDLDYGVRAVAEVMDEVRAWQDRYGLEGVMLDRYPAAPSDDPGARRAREVVARIRSVGVAHVAGNPGLDPAPGTEEELDVVCDFEGPAHEYADPSRPLRRGRGRWHLVYDCPATSANEVREQALERGADYVFVTDGVLPHPWAGLPAGAVG